MPVEYGSLAFAEAIEFFRKKLNVPTQRWNDLYAEMHNRGFMVAGAMEADLLVDLRKAVEKAIVEGTTLEAFRKDFAGIVEKYGWAYKGGFGWRTNIIYDTNVRQAYNAGRYSQMNDPEVKALRPYKIYKHGDSINPRPEHLAWHNTILPADDPWWLTHTPQNGWGCKCKVFTLSQRDLAKYGKSGPDTAPKTQYYEWTDKKTGEKKMIPKGIDPGFEYAPGEKDWKPNLEKYPPELRKHMEI